MANSTALQALLNGPAAAPPPGVVPNFVDPPSIATSVLAFTASMVVIATIVLIIRVFTKLYLMRAWHVEDYLIIIAWGSTVFIAVENFFLYQYGIGIDMWNIRLSHYLAGLPYLDNILITYSPTLMIIKVAILAQLLRIFVPHRKANVGLWWTIVSTIAVITVFYTVNTGFSIWKCNPREKAWNPLIPGTCFDGPLMYQVTGIFNIVSDFAILIIPMWPAWKLQLPRGKKFAIYALFAAGFVDCIASIMRTYETWILNDSVNTSYNLAITGYWLIAEIVLGIIVCCLPVAPRFLKFIRTRSRLVTGASAPTAPSVPKASGTDHSDLYPLSVLRTEDRDDENTSQYVKSSSMDHMSEPKAFAC